MMRWWWLTLWYPLVALVWFGLVVLAVMVEAKGATSAPKPIPSLPDLSAQVSALNHRVRLLENEVNRLQHPRAPQVQPGRIGRYCVESAAGLLECTDCRFIEQEATIVKEDQ